MRNLRRINRNNIEVDRKEDTFLQHVKDQVESAEVQTAVAFIKHTDGSIYYVTTESNNDELVGVVEIGKNALLNQDDD